MLSKRTDEKSKEVIFKNYASFIECTSEINNPPNRSCKNLVTPMYDLVEYRDNYIKIGCLCNTI